MTRVAPSAVRNDRCSYWIPESMMAVITPLPVARPLQVFPEIVLMRFAPTSLVLLSSPKT